MDISTMAARGYTIEAIQEEMLKCEVICSNCHIRRENEQRSGGRFRQFWPQFPWEERVFKGFLLHIHEDIPVLHSPHFRVPHIHATISYQVLHPLNRDLLARGKFIDIYNNHLFLFQNPIIPILPMKNRSCLLNRIAGANPVAPAASKNGATFYPWWTIRRHADWRVYRLNRLEPGRNPTCESG